MADLSTAHDPADVMKAGKEELEQLGWSMASVIGNELEHPELPHAEIRLLYSGGVVHLLGWHRDKGVTIHLKDHADDTDRMRTIAQNMHDLLWEENRG